MPIELLPEDEPGNPLPGTPPGFTDALMQRVADYRRKQRLRRRLAILLAVVAALVFSYMLRPRWVHGGRKQGAVHTRPAVASVKGSVTARLS